MTGLIFGKYGGGCTPEQRRKFMKGWNEMSARHKLRDLADIAKSVSTLVDAVGIYRDTVALHHKTNPAAIAARREYLRRKEAALRAQSIW